MPTKGDKTLKYNHGEKPIKAPFSIYTDLECLLIKENLVKTILMNLILKEKLSMSPRVTH